MAECVLGLSTILFWAYWLADGWGRDLVHTWRSEPQVREALAIVPLGVATANPDFGNSLPVSVEVPRSDPPVEQTYVAPVAPAVDWRPNHLTIPSIGLDSPITEVFLTDGSWQVADYAVGYHHGTGLPGSGNVVLAGHKGMRGAVFGKLESLKTGDDIWIDAGNERFHYRVTATGKVWPDQVGIMQPTAEPIVTLITCTNWDTQRFIAVASLVAAPAENRSRATNIERAYGDGER